MNEQNLTLSDIQREIIVKTQAGMPIDAAPYSILANKLGMTEDKLLNCLKEMQTKGILRRVALVPNHYKLGYIHNGMTVWKITENKISEIGHLFGDLPFVSHCYKRKTYPGVWEYNLFAMIHGQTREECDEYIKVMKDIAEPSIIEMDVLYSTKILKKTGLRLKK